MHLSEYPISILNHHIFNSRMGILRPFYVDSPSTWDDQDDGLDFASDPDQRHDKLPQPFRLINKILDALFEDTWSSITAREALKESQANFSQLPNVGP